MMDYYSVGIFFIQGTLVALLILVLFRFRKTLGIGILFACLGLFQFMQVFLSSTVYVKIAENMLVSPGSAVLFTASLFAVLIIYIKEDAAETRKIIYALLAVNLIMSVLLWLVSLLVRNSPDFNPLNVSTVVFSNNAWVLLIGTSALLIDTLLIIFLYELISRFVRYLYLRMIFSMTIVVCFDAIFFTLLALHGYDNYYSILYSGIVSKTVFVLYYSIFFSVFLKCFEKHSSEMVNVKFRDVFQTFSFRQKYEQVTKEVEKASKEIQLREDRYKILTDISPVGIFHADSNGATTYVNQRWCEMSGVKVDEAFGFGWLKAVHPDDVDRISGGWDEAVEKKRNSKTEYRFLRSDGTICWVLGNATAQMDESNNILGYVGTITDITKLKLFEQEQVRLREKAEESNKLKSAFLANVSHEIRTPMNGILGFADLIASDDITNSERKDYIEIIIQSGQRMLNIINDIISISRIEAGLVDIKMDHVNVNEIIDFVYTFFKPEADSKGIKLKSSCYLPEDKAFLRTDREKLLSILTNLVKNAIKYTESGVIEIGYSNKTNSFEFYVKDTGIGIKEERQQAVFERFVQADIDDKMAKQGAGLGLTISKAYVEKLGGKIWLESTIGVGSIFYFSIPDSSSKRILDSKLIVDTNHADYKFENLTVMIADDDNFSERHLTLVLKSWNCDVIIAKNGIEAINLYKSHPEIKIIMMDIKMPVMDGLTATREIRKIDNGIVIIAVTAYAMSSDVENAINAGCNEHVAKPIVRKDLLAKLIKYSR